MDQQVVSLHSLGNGSAVELFDHELRRVITNIGDPNTSHKVKRAITINVEIMPDEERNVGYVTITVKSKLASVKPTTSVMYFGKADGKLVAVESNPRQPGIFDSAEQRKQGASITPLSIVAGGKGETA